MNHLESVFLNPGIVTELLIAMTDRTNPHRAERFIAQRISTSATITNVSSRRTFVTARTIAVTIPMKDMNTLAPDHRSVVPLANGRAQASRKPVLISPMYATANHSVPMKRTKDPIAICLSATIKADYVRTVVNKRRR